MDSLFCMKQFEQQKEKIKNYISSKFLNRKFKVLQI